MGFPRRWKNMRDFSAPMLVYSMAVYLTVINMTATTEINTFHSVWVFETWIERMIVGKFKQQQYFLFWDGIANNFTLRVASKQNSCCTWQALVVECKQSLNPQHWASRRHHRKWWVGLGGIIRTTVNLCTLSDLRRSVFWLDVFLRDTS